MSATASPNGPRCFVAVLLPPPVREALFAAISPLERALPTVRWQRKIENLHLTLSFLGNVPDDRVRSLAAALPARTADISPFPIEVRGLGAFPSARRANVLWAGVEDPTRTLARMAGLFAAEADPREAGRPFRAHVTLGRCPAARKAGQGAGENVDARAALAAWNDTLFGPVTVDAVHLVQSRLGREGSTYTVLAAAGLVANP